MHISLSRRSVLGSAFAAALVPALDSSSLGSIVKNVIPTAALPSGGGTPRLHHTSTALQDGRVLMAGGYPASDASLPTGCVEIFDPRTGAWSSAAALQTPRARHAAALLPDGRVAVLGGLLDGALRSVEIYDPLANEWAFGDPLAAPMYDHAACAVGSVIVLSGGSEPASASCYQIRSVATGVAP